MSNPDELHFGLDRTAFFQIGRALQRGFGRELLGDVVLEVSNGHLRIESEFGGGEIPCAGEGCVRAILSAKAFVSFVTTRYREKAPSGKMELVFRPGFKEVAIDRIGVKAKFPALPSRTGSAKKPPVQPKVVPGAVELSEETGKAFDALLDDLLEGNSR